MFGTAPLRGEFWREQLSRATLVEIQAAHPDQLDVPIERMGGLVPSYEMCWRFFGGVQCRALLRQRPRPLCSSTCPGLGGRCTGAFCFLFGRWSVDHGWGRGDIRCGRPIREPDVGLDGLPSTESEIRLRRLEAARLQLTGEVKRLVSSRATAPQRPAVPLLPGRPKPAARRPTPGAGGARWT